MPRYSRYSNRWQTSHKPCNLDPGTWVTQRRLGSPEFTAIKAASRLNLDERQDEKCTAVHDNIEYKWTKTGKLAGSIGYRTPCSFCGFRARKGPFCTELLAIPSTIDNARNSLSRIWTSSSSSDFGPMLAEIGITPLCWRCIICSVRRGDFACDFVAVMPPELREAVNFIAAANAMLELQQ
jgi:hypothetical protein